MTHISYTQADQQFLADVNAYIERYISKQVITLAMIADSLQMSHAAIRYKIRLLTGLSGSDYILKVRLQHSLHQMIHEHRNVSEAATENGFKDLSYFHNCFKDEYGMTPMEYLDRLPARDITNLKKTIKTMKQRLIAMLLSLPLAVSVIQAQPITAGQHTRVETVYGTIEGYQDGSIFTFKGIQYAKAERFMPPQAPDKFEGIRQCKIYGPQAPQNESLTWNERNSQTDYGFGNQFVTEPIINDCTASM